MGAERDASDVDLRGLVDVPAESRATGRAAHGLLVRSLVVAGAIFAVDLAIPRGAAVGVAYVVTIVMLGASRVRWHPLAQAGVCTLFAATDSLVGAAGAALDVTLLNRGLSIGAVWLTAGLVARQLRLRSERHAAERRGAELLRGALQAAPDGMLLVDGSGCVRFANTAATALFARGALDGVPVAELMRERRGELLVPVAPASCPRGRPLLVVGLREGARELPLECTSSALAGAPPLVIVAIRDVSERLKYEERLRAGQRMEAIGKLAGGVAHDFNNVLGAIMAYSDFARSSLPAGSPASDDLVEIQQAAARAASLTAQLLAFSRRQVIQPRRLDLNAVVRDVEKLLRRVLGENVELDMGLCEHLWVAEIDPSQLEQVLLNLAVNARDAMPKGGRLTLETANVTLDDAYASVHPEVGPGDHVMLAVSDTGVGMTEAVRVRIFEPFFTTKPVGSGTGLGLATVYGIVKQAGGHIWVYSEPGEGTTFKIYVPRAVGDAEGLPAKRPALHAPGGSERILVVEDEPALRNVFVRSLRQAGYEVLEASNGADALLKVASLQGELDLLITDVVMPQMGGRELADKLRARQPSLRVLYLSGYTENAIVHHGVLDAVDFLQKPFVPNELLRRVRDVLDQTT
ncbi:MAG: response regulator [Myxococcales bacterium]|nr:response regulator [Myxococcales bacterium]